jgi:hypothetical protein
MSEEDKKSVPAVPGKNTFERFADDVDNKMIIGDLLKFVKGDWLVGRDDEEFAEKELVAIVPGLIHGWIRWQDGRPAGHAMGLLVEGFDPPDRAALGHQEESQWELDGKGEPRDPWRPSIYLPMVTVDGKRVFTFTTDSDGGRRRGVAPLCREYGHHIRQHPSEIPVVRLEQDSYLHPNRNIGRVKFPIFPADRWVGAEPYIAAVVAITGRPVNLLPGND